MKAVKINFEIHLFLYKRGGGGDFETTVTTFKEIAVGNIIPRSTV